MPIHDQDQDSNKESPPNWMEERMHRALEQRQQRGTLRSLQYSSHHSPAPPPPRKENANDNGENGDVDDDAVIDFSSNDYLGLAHDREQAILCHNRLSQALQLPTSSSSSSSSSYNYHDYSSQPFLGATGSRLLSGDSPTFHELELYLARLHRRPAAVLCNSGYDANLSVVSSLPCQIIVYDEYVHNSLHMGMRLWKSASSLSSLSDPVNSDGDGGGGDNTMNNNHKRTVSFRHNDTKDLERQLQNQVQKQIGHENNNNMNRIVVLIESVYSMDGDVSPVKEMLDICYKYGALLVVDEAHGLGVFGRRRRHQSTTSTIGLPGTGVVAQAEVEDHPSLLCSIHTFGKAAGCHGAVVCGSATLKAYLVNYGYPFIYSTALPIHSLITIRCSYETMTGPKGDKLRTQVFRLVRFFQDRFHVRMGKTCTNASTTTTTTESGGGGDGDGGGVYLLPSTSPIQALMVPGNRRCTEFCKLLHQKSSRRILLYPIKTPTVPAGQERIRIILHAHNTIDQVETLLNLIQATLEDMGLLNQKTNIVNSPTSSLVVQRSKL